MKLTKKLETEILKSYNAYWNSYLKGDMKTFAKMLDDNCHIIGSTEFDVFRNKKSAVKFYTSTADQIAGKADFRNRKITVMPSGENVMVEEFCDFYFLANDEWKFYGHCRLSTLFSEKESGWKIIYQHGSMPDSKAEEGEQIAAKEVVEENKKLRNAIKRRTVELETKNRELEIETALERVRTVAMAMRTADDLLEICKIVYTQLLSLGFSELRNVMINIHYDDKASLLNYDYSDNFGKTITDIPYNFHALVEKQVAVAKNAQDAFFEFSFEGEELKQFRELRKSNGEQDDPKLEITDSLHYYFFSIGTGSMGISTFSAIQEEKLELLKRFRNVFNLSYQRYTDISKAEAQAREAQIEVAMERTRTQSMIMQHSDELNDTLRIFHEQVLQLNIPSAFSFLWLPDEEKNKHIFWAIWEENKNDSIAFKDKAINYPLDRNEPATAQCLIDWKSGEPVFSYAVQPGDVEKYFSTWQELIDGVEKLKPDFFPDGLYYVEAFMKYGCFGVMVENDLSEDEKKILYRFAIEFERTYTRFLDLQKAEAQTRESQIQLALERVRAKAMAMHHSDELNEVLAILCDQFDVLGILPMSTQMTVFNLETNSFTFRETGKFGNRSFGEQTVDLNAMDTWKETVDQWKESKPFSINRLHFPKETLSKVWEVFHESLASMPEGSRITPDDYPDGIYHTAGKHPFGYIGMNQTRKATEEEEQIVIKFANEFGSAYQRFLDLQKAEAQARESQIQLALERVRARTMAMQKSEELSDAVYILFQQFKELGENPDQATIGVVNEDDKVIEYWVTMHGNQINKVFKFPIDEPNVTNKIYNAWKENKKSLVIDLSGRALREFMAHRAGKGGAAINPKEKRRIINVAFFSKGLLNVQSNEERSEESIKLLERFASVFEQTYTRFLDLQKAEAQAREAKIEASLERVRSRSMAMHKSDELKEAGELLWNELSKLGIQSLSSGYVLMDKEERIGWIYAPNPATGKISEPLGCLHTETKEMLAVLSGWRKQEPLCVVEMDEQRTIAHQTFIAERALNLDGTICQWITAEQLIALSPKRLFLHNFNFNQGYLLIVGGSRLTGEQIELMHRFTKVFQQTYTRFLDLQKAEAQAKEAQIEAALEKVRSRSMGMQKSEELKEVIKVVYEQFVHLNINVEHTGFIMDYKERDDMHIWLADQHLVPSELFIPYFDSAHWNSFNEAKEKGTDFFATLLDFEEKNKFYKDLFALIPGIPEETLEYYFSCTGLAGSTALLDNVSLYIENFQGIPYTDEENNTLMRFGKVFQQTYTRFLDLQKAEAQARESQIELSLERVRAKTMAMHNSADVGETAAVMVDELKKLGIETIRCGIGVMHEPGDMEVWTIRSNANDKSDIIIGWLDMKMHPLLHGAFETWRNKDEYYSYDLNDDDLLSYYNAINNYPGYPIRYDINTLPPLIHHNEFHFAEGTLFAFSLQQLTDEQRKIFKRFAGVFGQTYRRYLDLKNAEAQARQAKIEAAMEKVRARAMSMQKPDELVEVAELLRREMGLLGVEELETSSIYIHNEITHQTECWYAIQQGNRLVSDHMDINLNETEVGKKMLKFYHSNKKQISIPMQAGARKEWINYCAEHSKVLVGFYGDNIPDRTYHLYKFSNGYMGAASPGDISAESWDLLQRATSVFSLAYTRFSDLQKAEAQAREALIEAALERVRSRTLAMQKSDELAETSAVLFKQLIGLGIEPNRLYITIINEAKDEADFWITDEDGSKITAAYTASLLVNPTFQKMYDGWKQGIKTLTIDMHGKDLQEYFEYLQSIDVPFKGGLEQKRRLQYLAYFSNGFIGMAAPDEQPVETQQVLERFAAVFNLTFTRFNDLKIAEAHAMQAEEDLIKLQTEKRRAEDALTNLQAAQKQLVQSEKMASLGELTAGIAHEIQNPLNFVNNFSEVNKELIAEMREEISKGNYDEVNDIAKDVEANEEKINHHGKRAGDIVKGMLQHSRSSSGIKEPTDINALADEYLRLSYHGLRAKDKSFNAKMETDFDESIGKINIIPQDIGRVLLNLYNNAFYAVNQQKSENLISYEPTVSVTTKKWENYVIITVSDNGNGIPQKIVDKIFQPFFTTKPTGQGTGLGLSLSHDIIKAHGGEIKVETKEGEKTTFIIQLPFG